MIAHYRTAWPLLLLALLTLNLSTPIETLAGVGEAAVVTLSFPPGARATGLGEAFTGLADDANATFFNPAGLGLPPLANSWHLHLPGTESGFTSIAAKKKRGFDLHPAIWAASPQGLKRFNDRAWETFERYLIEKDDDLESIVQKSLGEQDDKSVIDAINRLRIENKIGMKHFDDIYALLSTNITTATIAAPSPAESIATTPLTALAIEGDSTNDLVEIADSDSSTTPSLPLPTTNAPAMVAPPDLPTELKNLALKLSGLPEDQRTKEKIFALVSGRVDSTRTDNIVSGIAAILSEKDIELIDLVELKIPFSLAIHDSITTIIMDDNDQLWVGTVNGLWRYGGTSWKQYTILEGLPSNHITALAAHENGSVLIGTTSGIGLLNESTIKTYDVQTGLADSFINAVAFGKDSTLYAGTKKGVSMLKRGSWVLLDTATGLISSTASALFFDSENKLWVGGDNGIAIFNEISWKRYKFPDSRVYCFAESQAGTMWIGTNKGAIVYVPGKTVVDDKGKTTQQPPTWKVYHSKNALQGDEVRGLAISDRDIWLATEKAINQYQNADRQIQLFWEPLLPAFGIKELWHSYASIVWPLEDWGTFAIHANFIHMGVNIWTNELGQEIGNARSWELVLGLAYGLALREDLSLGVNAKFINSALAPGIGSGDEGVGRTFAIDAAILKRNLLLKGLDLGFNMQNMGPAITYSNESNKDPIPYTWKLGLAYRALQTPSSDLTVLLDLNREIVHSTDGKPDPFYTAIFTDLGDTTWQVQIQEIQVNAGLEYWYVNFLALRSGFLFDYMGERYEWTLGLGLKYGNLNVDWSYIVSPEGFLKTALRKINPEKTGSTGARDGQWRISLITRF